MSCARLTMNVAKPPIRGRAAAPPHSGAGASSGGSCLEHHLQQRVRHASAHARGASVAVRFERCDDGHGRSHVVDDSSRTRRVDSRRHSPLHPHVGRVPSDPRALSAADWVLKSPADGATAQALARRCGLSARTLERLFRAETGMRFGLWRQKARLLESVRVLVEGGSVTDAALESGYASVSAYIAAFKQTFGCTPGAMLTDEAVAGSFADTSERSRR